MNEPKFAIGDTLTHVAGCGEKLFVVEMSNTGSERCYHCRVISRVGISGSLAQFNEIELMEIPKPDPAKEVADTIDSVKEWAVGIQEFDLAAKLRDLKQKMVDTQIDFMRKRSA